MPSHKPTTHSYQWIDQSRQLGELIDLLKKQSILAVDTESNSLYAYREQVCLIQFSTLHMDYLVDPLELNDLSGLAPVFSNPKIEKVFHAAEYDLICLKRDFNFRFCNIFDTMHAARVLGRKNLGLAALLQEYFGVELDKKFQRANWGQRPLPETMKEYAHIDSHYLIPLRDRLKEELVRKNLFDLAQEDFRRLTQVEPQNLEPAANAWQISGSQKLEPQQRAVLKKLWEMREKFARQQNKPLFKIMSNNDLLALSQACPQNASDLMRAETVHFSILNRYQDAILAAVRQGSKSAPISLARTTRLTQAVLRRMDALKKWRTQAARELKVESDIILPRETLESIARANPRNVAELKPILIDQKWRWKKFAREIIHTIHPREEK